MEKKSLTKNSIYYLVCQVLNVVFPFLTGMYVARILMPEAVGKVAYAQNIAQYFAILAFLGIPTYGIREVSKLRNNKELLSKTYTELMVINFVSTSIFLLLYVLLILNVSRFKEDIYLYYITGGSIILNYINNTWLFDGLEEFRFTSIRNIIFKFICFFLLVLLVKTKEDYCIYAFINVFGTGGNYLINMFYTRKYVKLDFTNMRLKNHLKPIMILVTVNLAIELYSLVDVSMLGWFCDKKHVAFYSYGNKICGIFRQLINSFTMVVVPRLAFYYGGKDKENFNRLISKTLKIIMVLGIPIMGGIQLTANNAIILLYGEKFIPSAGILKLLSLTLIISPVGYLLGSRVLLVTNNEKKMVLSVGAGAVINIICNYFLIQNYYEVGAAVASVISEFVVMIIYVYLGRKFYILVDFSRTLMKTIFATVIMMILLSILGLLFKSIISVLIIQVLVGVISYFLILILLKEQLVVEFADKVYQKLRRKSV